MLLLFTLALVPVPSQGAPALFESTALTLSVSDPDRAAADLIGKAEALGGYFTELSDQAVTVRIPSALSPAFVSYCNTLGILVERRLETRGYDEALDQARTSLAAKQDILNRYLAVLKASKRKTIVGVERAVMEVVGDIERLKGSIAFMEHELAFARVTVSFRFTDRSVPAFSGRSSFPWLNTLSLATLIEEFTDEK
ncbi:hypothetical protein JCM14469_33900 [Desulfatiferula olefinivorans]